jgi:sugar phosphate isomerase/epimerase
MSKLAICQWSIPIDEPMNAICMAAELGLEGVELDLGPWEAGLPLARPEVRRSYAQWRERYGIAYPSLAVNALCQHGMSDPASRGVALTCIALAVETAAQLSIPLVQLPSFAAGAIGDEAGFESTVACLRYACQVAESHDILIGSENGLLLEDQRRLLDQVAHPSLRIYFDTYNHFAIHGLPGPELLEALYDHVVEVHLKDGVSGQGPALLGQGQGDLFASLDVLTQRGFDGWLVLEGNYVRLAQEMDQPGREVVHRDVETVTTYLAG